MKKPETTLSFIMICIVMLVAAYGIAVCINEINASKIKAAQNRILIQEIQDSQINATEDQTQDTFYSNTQNSGTNRQNNTGRSTQNYQSYMNGNNRSFSRGPQNLDEQQSFLNNSTFFNNQRIPGTQKTSNEPNN